MKATISLFIFILSLPGHAQSDSSKKVFYFKYSAGLNLFASYGAEHAGYHLYAALNWPRYKLYAGPLLGRKGTIQLEFDSGGNFIDRTYLYHGFGFQGMMAGVQYYPGSPLRRYKFFREYCIYYLTRKVTINNTLYNFRSIQNTVGFGGKLKLSKRLACYQAIFFGLSTKFSSPSYPKDANLFFQKIGFDIMARFGLEYNLKKRDFPSGKRMDIES